MLEKILTDEFRKKITAVIRDIQNYKKRVSEKEFEKDKERIMNELLTEVEIYPPDIVLDEDYLVAAIDGSGSENFGLLDDIRIHLISTAIVVLDTNTRNNDPFKPLSSEDVSLAVGNDQPNLELLWHLGVREDAAERLAEMFEMVYPTDDIPSLVLPFFQDILQEHLETLDDLINTEYGQYISNFHKMGTLISRGNLLTTSAAHDELRKTAEYAAAKQLLISDIRPRFLMLDGAMSVFIHFARQYPSLPSGFMLRDLCKTAREKGTVLCAVSKNHTIPFAHRIAKMAEEKFGKNKKWFCLLPSDDDPGGGLHIYSNRNYIPPRLAVPYLFSFSGDNRPSRIDFDRIWWLENIFVEGDPEATRNNEVALFRELEFMSRDARWYGYPVPLALAHSECKVSYEDLLIAKDILSDALKESGFDSRMARGPREDYGM